MADKKKEFVIKTSKVKIHDLNSFKSENLSAFISDYSEAVKFYVNYLWNNRIDYSIKGKPYFFDIKNGHLDVPKYLSTTEIYIKTDLLKRALGCAMSQALGIIKSRTTETKKLQYIKSKLIKKGKRTRHINRKIEKHTPVFPDLDVINPELRSLCSEYVDNKDKKSIIDGFVILSCIGEKYGKIVIPVRLNKHARKLEAEKGILMKSFQISKEKDFVYFKYKIIYPEKKTEGRIVGADSGIVTCLTLSDGQATTVNKHGHDLQSITKILSRRKPGSKGFERAKAHQENYVNWSINSLDFSNISQVNYEHITNYRGGKRVGKFLNHFCHALIEDVTDDKLKRLGVRIRLNPSSFRSQRCKKCAYVCGKNRKGKVFSCKRCNYTADADYNGSCNHEDDLPDLSFFRILPKRPKEFYWRVNGVFDLEGQEIGVPGAVKGNG
jgi:transposase